MDDLKDELENYNLAIYKKSLQHWDTSFAGWVVYFDHESDPSDLVSFLSDPIKKITKFDPTFAFRSKKVYNGSQKRNAAPKRSIVTKKKNDNDFKAFHAEVLNDHKVGIVCALKKNLPVMCG